MGIRDMVNRVDRPGAAGTEPDVFLHEGAGVDGVRALAVGAVSYTHLRAHETVLDLLCRLLLETKYNIRTVNHVISHMRHYPTNLT